MDGTGLLGPVTSCFRRTYGRRNYSGRLSARTGWLLGLRTMSRAPYVIAATLAAAGIAWAIHLGVAPEPFAASSALAIAAGIVIFTVVSVVGLLLVRAPWARWLAFATLALGLVVAAITDFDDITAVVALVLSLVAIGGLSGPWLRVWLRRRPSATGPEPRAAVLPLAALGLVPLIGFVSPDGLTILLVMLATASVVAVVGYIRANSWGLWGLRLVVPALTIGAAVGLDAMGAIALLVGGGTVTALAWTPAARRAIRGSVPPLPAPRHRSRTSPAESG